LSGTGLLREAERAGPMAEAIVTTLLNTGVRVPIKKKKGKKKKKNQTHTQLKQIG